MSENGPPSGPSADRPASSSPQPDDERSTGEEAAQILSEVLDDQREKRARRNAAGTRKRKSETPKKIVTAGMAVVLVILLVARPDFLSPEPVPEPSRELIEAGLRMDMYSTAVQIRRYREERDRLPENLRQVLEEDETDLRYTRLEPSYYLVGNRAGVEIVYRSDEPLDSLLADAREVIRRGARGGPGPGPGGGS